jgi:hypothetical protein
VLTNLTLALLSGTTFISYLNTAVQINITKPIALASPSFTKNYNTPGEPTELIFKFFAPIVVNYETRFLIHLPHYYPEQFVTNHLLCQVEQQNRLCYVVGERTLAIEGSVLYLDPLDIVEILIFGVVQPSTTEIGTFSIAMNNKTLNLPYDYLASYTDIAASSLPPTFTISNLTISNTNL